MSTGTDAIQSQSEASQILGQQVDRILNSNTFRTSEVLRNLLSFLAARALEGHPESIRVKEIARLVFGRSEDFDSQSDSVVRVHMGRLRARLAEYYVDEAPDSEIVIAVPKGSYALSWHHRHPVLAPRAEPAHQSEIPPASQPDSATLHPAAARRPYARLAAVLALVSVGLAFSVGILYYKGASAEQRKNPALSTFWHGFIRGQGTPLMVFSNLKLVGSVANGMHIYRGDPADRDKPEIGSWSTLGEVMGVYQISRTLSLFQRPVEVKPGRLLTWDDAKDSDVIFVGGPLADTPLKDISIFREFRFENGEPGTPAESGAIVNLHPRKGEAAIYYGPEVRPFSFDYAVISLQPGFNSSRQILALAGITEFGTEGAAEFVSREDLVSTLLAKLGTRPGQPVPWFEALLRIRIQGGVPVEYEPVLVHK